MPERRGRRARRATRRRSRPVPFDPGDVHGATMKRRPDVVVGTGDTGSRAAPARSWFPAQRVRPSSSLSWFRGHGMPRQDAIRRQLPLIDALRNPAVFGRDCTAVEVVETHISWVLLTGAHAYKIKKAVVLDFLDFTALESRRRFCLEELRLNRRLRPGSLPRRRGDHGQRATARTRRRRHADRVRSAHARVSAVGAAVAHRRRRRARGRRHRRAGGDDRRFPRPERRVPRRPPRRAGGDPALRRRQLPADRGSRRSAGRWRRPCPAAGVDAPGARGAARRVRGAPDRGPGPRVPRRPPPRQRRADRRRDHDLRRHRVQRAAALDRRRQRDRVHGHGPRGPWAAGVRPPLSRCLPRGERRLRRARRAALLRRLPRAGACQGRVPARASAAAGAGTRRDAPGVPRLRRSGGRARAGPRPQPS